MSEDLVVATGRRKTAVASVRLRHGTGKIDVNGREFDNYFPTIIQQETVLAPFKFIGGNGQYDMIIRVNGGGVDAQSVAARLAVARALQEQNESLHADLKAQGFLTRDSRKKERKKYGHAGARKRFQFSKR